MKIGTILGISVGVVTGVIVVIFLVNLILGVRNMMREQHIKDDKYLTSYLNSRGFKEASFTYKILSAYWNKEETSRGRILVAKRMMEVAKTPEEWKEISELTSVWEPEVNKKVKEKLKELGISF